MNVVELEISGNSKQETRSGYNMLNVVRASDARKGIEFTNNGDGSFTLNGTCSEGELYIDLNNSTGNRFTLTQGKKYLLYLKGIQQGVNFNARTSEDVSSITLNGNDGQESIFRTWNGETSENGFVHISVAKGTVINNKTFYPMIAESDVELEYEPYGAMPSPSYPSEIETVNTQANVVVSNKNILKITSDTRENTRNGVQITIDDDGLITLNGTATAIFWPDLLWGIHNNTVNHDVCKYKTLRMNKATFSLKHISGTINQNNMFLIVVFNDSSDFSASLTAGSTTTSKCVEGDIKGINRAYLTINSGMVFNNYKFYLQLEEGETETDFAVPKQQTKVVDIQQEMLEGDYFIKEEDGWKEVHGWDKKMLHELDNWNNQYGIHLFNVQSVLTDLDKASRIGLCNYFKYNSVQQYINDNLANGEFAIQVEPAAIFFKDERFDNVTDWKNWLAQKYNEGNPVYVWYKLATPTRLACTEKQVQQLDDLLNTSTYKNVTHIYSTDKVSPIIKIKYRKDIETMFNTQQSNYDTRLSNIEKLLSTTTTSAMLLDNLQSDLEKEVL